MNKVKIKLGCVCSNTDDWCWAKDNNGIYHCTRPKGHKGDHVACGTISHNLSIWRKDNKINLGKIWRSIF